MRLFILVLLSLLATACLQSSSVANQNDIKSLLERAESCTHFAGEISGDKSERDKEVIVEMDQLKCGDIDKELAAVKEKYKNNPELFKMLEQASTL